MRRLGVQKKLGGGTARTGNPNWPKRYSVSYDIMLSNKSRSKERGRGRFRVIAFVFPINCDEPYFPGSGWKPACQGDKVNYSPLLVHTTFALPFKLPLSQPRSFLTFPLLILSPSSIGKWASSRVVLSCPPGLTPYKVSQALIQWPFNYHNSSSESKKVSVNIYRTPSIQTHCNLYAVRRLQD